MADVIEPSTPNAGIAQLSSSDDPAHRRRSRRLTPRHFGLALYFGLNVGLILAWGPTMLATHRPDWEMWQAVWDGLRTGNLYDLGTEIPFAWSPVIAPLMAAVAALGFIPWTVINLAALALLRDWRLAAVLVLSLGFWTNVAGGNTFLFVVIAGVRAYRGSLNWAIVFFILFLVAPRPIQAPLAAWLVWRMPALRLPALGLFLAHALIVVATGYALPWIETMVSLGVPTWSMGPSFWLGFWWLAIGIPLGLVLLWQGRPGWAGLAVSSYWVPAYFLMPIVEVRKGPDR
jgi:hypothetical protein